MKKLSDKQYNRLIIQQNNIINSEDKYILVSAGPGSGKTYTLVKRIIKDLEVIDKDCGIIACSFTNEASKQLQNKLKNLCNVEGSFIGTIDSFVLTEIIDPFKNRFLKTLGYEPITKLKIRMPEIKSESSSITRIGNAVSIKKRIDDYVNVWLENFSKGKYEISFASYIVAELMIHNMILVKEYLKNRYKVIYVDEAQDLNEFQINFIRTLIKECQLGVVLIGDKNQSIYRFRGARPEMFYNMKAQGFKEYVIDVSVRCHKSILDFANKYIDNAYLINEKNELINVKKYGWPTTDYLNNLEGNYMILFEDNHSAENCFNYLKANNANVILARNINITDKDFKDNFYDLLEETLSFYFNYDNGKLTYTSDEFYEYLSDFIELVQLKKLKDIQNYDNVISYFEEILHLSGDYIPESTKIELLSQINDEKVINRYRKYEKVNRIMTIHASKGLEAEHVFVRINKVPSTYDDEYKRKLYVGFTRAINSLYICLTNDVIGTFLDAEITKIINEL